MLDHLSSFCCRMPNNLHYTEIKVIMSNYRVHQPSRSQPQSQQAVDCTLIKINEQVSHIILNYKI